MHALIFADNKYQSDRIGILRAPGAHRIATLLRSRNIQTEVIDFYLDWSLDELKKIIDLQLSKPTLFVGFSCSLMFDGVNGFNHIRDYIKLKNPSVAIIVGGFHTTQKGFEGADWYIEGYGEYAILSLVEHLLDRSKLIKFELDEQGRRVIYTKEQYPVNSLTSLNTEYQFSDFIQPNETLSIETARGCVFKCKFCSFQLLGKSKVDYLRDVEEIRNEFIINYQRYSTVKYIVTEDTFNDTDDKVNMFYDIVKSLPFELKFMGYVRADLLASKPGNLRKLIECGFTSMHFGIETFNSAAGKIVGKGMDANKLKQALIKFKTDYPNIYTNGTFIIGLPGESPDDIRETAQWIIDSKTLDFWTFNPLMIPKRNKLIYSSEFTNDYLLYGYNKMSTVDLAQYPPDNNNLLFANKISSFIIDWKNKYFNSYTAAKLATELNQLANPYKKIDAWTTFAISSLGYDLIATQKHTYSGINPLNQLEIKEKTKQFIENYKQNKLKHLTKELY
jgi:hypothetical protein